MSYKRGLAALSMATGATSAAEVQVTLTPSSGTDSVTG